MIELRQQMKDAVAKLYPTSDSEKLKSGEEQKSQLPDDLVDLIHPSSSEHKRKTVQFAREKSSTPSDGGAASSDCLWNHRPHSVFAGVSTGAIGDPSATRMGAIMQHDKIEVQTGHKLVSQWESKYISQVLPFVIPFMVSGPDYSFHEKTNRWRRRDDPRWAVAPLVSASTFTAAFARRCESQCRQDWNALPIIRSVNFRYTVETGNTMVSVPMWWKRGSAVQLSAQEHANMVKKLCETLWNGHIRYGNIKVPLNGDTTRLHLAEGLNKAEKLLAKRIGYMASHFSGTQAVRQLMAHRHWGARVNYGDCLFLTSSPNERHSAFMLRLSRYRPNDPCISEATPIWNRLRGMH